MRCFLLGFGTIAFICSAGFNKFTRSPLGSINSPEMNISRNHDAAVGSTPESLNSPAMNPESHNLPVMNITGSR